MGRRELPQVNKVAVFKNFMIFNFAAVIGFVLGTAAFTGSMVVFPNATFAWLFGNVIGGISHFGANYVMQRQTKDKIVKNFVVFNATGIIGFLLSSGMFALALVCLQNSTAAWLCGSLVGTFSHFALNYGAMNFKLNNPTKP